MESENAMKQCEEIEALTSIYGSDWTIESARTHSVKIVENKMEVVLHVTLPPDYPGNSAPEYDLAAPHLTRKFKEKIHQALDEVYLENIGETVIFQWVERIREMLQTIKSAPEDKKNESTSSETELSLSELEISCPNITHGEVIVDRRSSFQGHAAAVQSVSEVKAVLQKLKDNKKILNATHNMYAYRIEKKTEKGTSVLQDCDDDGESHAGGRMLHLLQILDQKNTLVVVSRWYGGVQLGPDRFRHINNATRQVLLQSGLLKK